MAYKTSGPVRVRTTTGPEMMAKQSRKAKIKHSVGTSDHQAAYIFDGTLRLTRPLIDEPDQDFFDLYQDRIYRLRPSTYEEQQRSENADDRTNGACVVRSRHDLSRNTVALLFACPSIPAYEPITDQEVLSFVAKYDFGMMRNALLLPISYRYVSPKFEGFNRGSFAA